GEGGAAARARSAAGRAVGGAGRRAASLPIAGTAQAPVVGGEPTRAGLSARPGSYRRVAARGVRQGEVSGRTRRGGGWHRGAGRRSAARGGDAEPADGAGGRALPLRH